MNELKNCTTKSNDETLVQVSEIMTRSVVTIGVNDRVSDALRKMVDQVTSLPVINESGQCVGVISKSDLTESLFAEDQTLAQLIDSGGRMTPLAASALDTCNERYVRELMTDSIKSIEEDTTVREACRLMSKYSIHHLPVISEKGSVVGMVSSLDLIRCMAG